MPDEEPPLKRESAGRYRTRDERFAVEQNSGRWLVLDTEQTDELGLPLVRGPFSTLDDAREAIATARTGPAPTSPLARRAKAASPRKAAERSGSRAPKAGTAEKRVAPEPEPQPEPAPPPLVIRRLEPGDGPALRRLAEEAGGFEAGGRSQRSSSVSDHAALDARGARRLLADADVYLLVAFEADAPVGFLVAHELPRPFGDPVRLFVREVRVRAERRREGIGRRLLESLWAIGREHGIGSAFVIAETDDRDALAFYRAAGGKRSRREMAVVRFSTAPE